MGAINHKVNERLVYDLIIGAALLASVLLAVLVWGSGRPRSAPSRLARCCGGFCRGEIVWAAPTDLGYSLAIRHSLDYAQTWEAEREIIALPGQTKLPWPSLTIWRSPAMSYTHIVWVEGENPPHVAHGYASMQDIIDRAPWTVGGAISASQYAQVWPAVRADDDGNLIAVWQQSNDRGGADITAFSNAAPPVWNDWSQSAQCINDACGTAVEHIRPDMATNEDSFQVVWAWDNGAAQGINYDLSTDGGQTWGADTTIVSGTEHADWPVIVLDVPPPQVHVAWQQRSVAGDWDVYYAHPNVGGTWTTMPLATGTDDQTSPSIAISPTMGTTSTVYVVWLNETQDQVQIAYKQALSRTFGAAINVNLPGRNFRDPIVLFNPISLVFVAADAEITTPEGKTEYAVVSNQSPESPEQGGPIVDDNGNPLGDGGAFADTRQEIIMQPPAASDTPALSLWGLFGLTATLSGALWAMRRRRALV